MGAFSFLYMTSGSVAQYKVAYIKPKQHSTLYSAMADTKSEAKAIALALSNQGCRVVIMENLDMSKSASGEYAWRLLPDEDGRKVKAGIILTDSRFWIVAGLILIAAFFLSKSRFPIRVASTR